MKIPVLEPPFNRLTSTPATFLKRDSKRGVFL